MIFFYYESFIFNYLSTVILQYHFRTQFEFILKNKCFYFFTQSTCRKTKKIPDTVWMTMIQQYNKSSGKDGKQQGIQVRNEFQSQACPWPSTHSDRVQVGKGPPITCLIVGGNAAKCWHWTVFPCWYNKCWKKSSCVLIYFFIVCKFLWKTEIFLSRQSLQRKTWKWIKTIVSSCVYMYSFSYTTKETFTMIALNETAPDFYWVIK